LSLTETELQWLKRTCPYLTPTYLAYLSSYQYKPEQAKIKYIPVTSDKLRGHVEIEISGLWAETILWEVPLMACLSESYFQVVVEDWNYNDQDSTYFSYSLLTNVLALIHEILKQTLLIRRLRPYLKHSATSANLEHDVEDHTKHKTSL
jgi:nicotinic acid phosphoribosyltransferase